MKIKFIIMGILFPCFSMAQEVNTANEVVVTASRLPESEASVMADIKTVSSKQMELHNVKTLTDAFSLLPGIQVLNYGGRGQAANFYVRGGNAEHVLILLDGNPLNSSGISALNPNFIPANIIEKIEYIRGQKATVYGANSISGVINIITKPDYRNKQSLKYAYSSYATHDFNFNNTVAINENSVIKLSGGAVDSKGYNVHPLEGLNNGEKHGYKERNFNAVFSYLTEGDVELWGSYNYILNSGEYDNSYYDWISGDPVKEKDVNDIERSIFSLGSKYNSSFYSYDLGLMYTNSNDYSYPIGDSKIGTTASPFKINALAFHFTNSFKLNDRIKLGFGVDFDNNILSKNSAATGIPFSDSDKSLVNRAVYANTSMNYDVYLLDFSIRSDDNSIYGSHTSISMGTGVNISNASQIALRLGTAYRAPTMMELYYPMGGNSSLNEEKSQNIELAYKGNIDSFGYYINAYYTEIEDLIGYDMNTWKYFNVGEAKIKGLELGLHYKYENVIANISADLTDPQNSQTGETIRYRAKQTYKADVAGEYGNFDFSGGYNFLSKRYTSSSPLGGFGLVNIGAGYTWQKQVRFGVNINNLFDKNYQMSSGYATEGRVYLGSIELKNFF